MSGGRETRREIKEVKSKVVCYICPLGFRACRHLRGCAISIGSTGRFGLGYFVEKQMINDMISEVIVIYNNKQNG